MKSRDKENIDRELRGANPLDATELAALNLDATEAALGKRLFSEPSLAGDVALPAARHRRRRSTRLIFVAAVATPAIIAAILLTAASGSPQTAYGAELVRFAESTPLLLLEGPAWRVQSAYQAGHGPYMPRGSAGAGSMEFVTGEPIPDESDRVSCVREVMSKNGRYPICKAERESGMLPPTVRQRRVELSWHHGKLPVGRFCTHANSALELAICTQRRSPHPHGQRWVELPVLGTTADVDTRAEFYVNQGGPGNRQMTALWSEGGYVLELSSAVPDLAAFEERLNWLTRVDSQTWLEAMPPSVVKAASHSAVVDEMLKGIPLPDSFNPSQIRDEGLTTSRSQVAGQVTGTVACLWFRQWGKARRSGDNGAEVEAEQAMASFRQWPILRQMAKQGGEYPETLAKLVASMPSGVWQFGPHRWRLLPKAEGLGCARWGIPVLPWKQRRQREGGEREPATASS